MDTLSTTLAALADPTRRAIVARLTQGEASVSELAQPFRMSLPAISKHLKVLERSGLISRGREAQWRPCRLETERLRELADWLTPYRQFWEGTFDSLEAHLEAQHGSRPARKKTPKRSATRTVTQSKKGTKRV